ncbi:RNA polymerase sigma factor [Paraliomyxa miuraensis]|uniref:RNA polymerase sigma factor n=1 Tax=Paraliomyxa miuraensis TaxID=376150 RepID=UPI00224E4DBB|nr:sigma-70 family RNA polymerase sigma factor [Paraliomyxa miuraensis]MCX4241447.1 sigma-70 family RNA polymerase sigma factor [Paraliomyxa miuraensis]
MDPSDTSDEALLQAWRAGDQHAGSALFERHYASIYRFFLSKVPEAADDLVQRTFLGCLEAQGRFRHDASLRTFLFGIAHNTLRHHLRGRHRSEQPLDSGARSAAELAPGPSTVLGRRQEQRLLLRALRHIPLDYQVALELHYWEAQSAAQISEITGLPVGTVKTRLRRGRQLLQERITELAETPELRDSTLGGFDDWLRALPEPAAALR